MFWMLPFAHVPDTANCACLHYAICVAHVLDISICACFEIAICAFLISLFAHVSIVLFAHVLMLLSAFVYFVQNVLFKFAF